MTQKITLISDWRQKDPYIALFKNKLDQEIPGNQIYDLSHSIGFGLVSQAAFLLKNTYSQFPENTLHIILVANSFNRDKSPIVVKCNNHYFLGEDTGIFSLLVKGETFQAYQFKFLPKDGDFLSNLTTMARWITEGNLEENVIVYNNMQAKFMEEYTYYKNDNTITGEIVYIDSYHNAVTNIPTEAFLKYVKNKPFKATVGEYNQITIQRFHPFYNEREREIYFVANRLGHIEISMYNGKVATLANLQVNDKVTITIN